LSRSDSIFATPIEESYSCACETATQQCSTPPTCGDVDIDKSRRFPMAKKKRKRRARAKNKANHGKRPNT
jgi:hypothetical protein